MAGKIKSALATTGTAIGGNKTGATNVAPKKLNTVGKKVSKGNIKFADDIPLIIGYREISDDEDDEAFEASLRAVIAASTRNPDADYDDDHDPERVKLNDLTQANTLFNANPRNFSEPEPKKSGPVLFKIQDGYQQPLAPTKFANNGTAAFAKRLFETNGGTTVSSCDNTTKSSEAQVKKPVTSTTSQQPSSPTNNVIKANSISKPVVASEKPKLSEKPQITKPKPSASATSSEIPTIRIPRATIQPDKLKLSPPPSHLHHSPLGEAVKPKPPPLPVAKPPLNREKPEKAAKLVKTADNKSNPIDSSIGKQSEHRNSVILHDASEGSILTLDSQKLPPELKNEDVVDNEQLYLVSTKQQQSTGHESSKDKDHLDSMSDSGSDSGASGCSPLDRNSASSPNPSSQSPTQQLSDGSVSSQSVSPTPDSLDSSPDSYDLLKSPSETESDLSSRPSPVPPPSHPPPPAPTEPLQPRRSSLHPGVPPPPADQFKAPKITPLSLDKQHDSVAKASESVESSGIQTKSVKELDPELALKPKADPTNPNNKTLISISYRRSSSQQSDGSIGSADSGQKRNQMLARLAQDLEQHRSPDGSVRSSSSASLSSAPNTAAPVAIVQTSAGVSAAIRASDATSQQSINQFIEDLQGSDEDEEDDSRLMKIPNKKLFGRKAKPDSDDSDLSDSFDSDSDAEPLPDQIASDENDSDLSDDDFDPHHHHGGHRRKSAKDGESSKSSNSSLGSRATAGSGNNNKVSTLFKQALNSDNTKKYTKFMKKNITKTSRFIVSTTKQIGSETSDMMKKLKAGEKGGGPQSGASKYADRDPGFYYPDEYSEPAGKSKSKWTFSPNSQTADDLDDETSWDGGEKEKKKKKFEMYSLAKKTFRNIEGKIRLPSKSSASVQPEAIPGTHDPFSNGDDSRTGESPQAGASLLKIKRLDSMMEPINNQSAPNLLLATRTTSTISRTVASESNLPRPPLPPPRSDQTYRVAPPVPPPSSPPELDDATPPQAPLRRKKLAKKRDQLIQDAQDSSLEFTIAPESIAQESKVSAAPKPFQQTRPGTLSEMLADFERQFSQEADPNSVTIVEQCTTDSRLFNLYRCTRKQQQQGPESEDFYLLSSKIVWTTCYDHETAVPTTTSAFHGQPFRYLPPQWHTLVDIGTFCKQHLNSSDPKRQSELFASADVRANLVDSLVLQLHSMLARFELGTISHSSHKPRPRTVGDVNESLVAVTEDQEGRILDVLLLLPTRELDGGDEDENGEPDSLSMMQSWCLQVFLIRLTSMITGEDHDGDSATAVATGVVAPFRRSNSTATTASTSPHYRILKRRNQRGFTSLRDLYVLCAVDVFHVLGTVPKKAQTVLSQEQIADTVQRWFQGQPDQLLDDRNGQKSILIYLQATFATQADNQTAAVQLVQKELQERS